MVASLSVWPTRLELSHVELACSPSLRERVRVRGKCMTAIIRISNFKFLWPAL